MPPSSDANYVSENGKESFNLIQWPKENLEKTTPLKLGRKAVESRHLVACKSKLAVPVVSI
jgi:hypothetical protein